MKKHRFYITDVFTNQAFGGNQLAVFPEASTIEEVNFQKIAREINFSETTFVLPPTHSEADFKLRIFTPFTELPMAGHPTIGTSFVLKKNGLIQKNNIIIEEGVGNIPVVYEGDRIWMNQLVPQFKSTFDDLRLLSKLLSLDESDISSIVTPQVVSCGVNVFIIMLNSLKAVEKTKLNLDLYENILKTINTNNIMVFTTESEYSDSSAHSRFFAPALGINEDPATGGAAGPLACLIVQHNLAQSNKLLKLEQGFKMGRPSILYAYIEKTEGTIKAVRVGGESVLIAEGNFYLYK